MSHNWEVWLAAFITLAVYSYLINDNKLYRLMLNIMIGLAVGYSFIVMWKTVLGPLWWDPMAAGISAIFRGFAPGSTGALWVFVGVLGSFWYFQFSKRYLWLSRIVIGMTLGAAAGAVFKQQLLLNAPQITDSFRSFAVRQDGTPIVGGSAAAAFSPFQSFNNILFVITIVCVMVYFFFSFEHRTRPVRSAARSGRWLLMISFGAYFGNTVMTRMAVFLERLQFLLRDWLGVAR